MKKDHFHILVSLKKKKKKKKKKLIIIFLLYIILLNFIPYKTLLIQQYF